MTLHVKGALGLAGFESKRPALSCNDAMEIDQS